MSSPKPSSKLPFRIGTKRTRVGKFPHAFETERKIYGRPGGKIRPHYQHMPQRDPTLKGIVDALKQVKTTEFSIRVLGKLQETPENYPADQFPPFEYLYLGAIRNTANALTAAQAAYRQYGNDWYQMREWVNSWSNFKWSEVATIYISER